MNEFEKLAQENPELAEKVAVSLMKRILKPFAKGVDSLSGVNRAAKKVVNNAQDQAILTDSLGKYKALGKGTPAVKVPSTADSLLTSYETEGKALGEKLKHRKNVAQGINNGIEGLGYGTVGLGVGAAANKAIKSKQQKKREGADAYKYSEI